ncbi:AmmeMemoRadiSam system protein A [Ammoniphilus sp. CFH 90114]|uniref:AmmeMemoRadiSam system protein A n=1 Tax=Ammoniphilus sp. CFH 90114 TaxID=2493665 RepID=UPI00100FF01F|nr:AmmeMemoRadiSam system protein A [Ammoniphilus sp. CFH 90114]RXT03950.1 AmmeMemoRadiSam system protein A [Ammoniphilus sp. CFH 90114]
MNTSILFGALVPHPPLLIPDIGGDELKQIAQTEAAMRTMASEVASADPELLVIISPHGIMFEDAVTVMGGTSLKGNLQAFDSLLDLEFSTDEDLAMAVVEEAQASGSPVFFMAEEQKDDFGVEMELNYGALVPLYFAREAGYRGKVLHISPGYLDVESLYFAGIQIGKSLRERGIRTVIIASGDNSHALSDDSPEGFREEGPRFDLVVSESIERNDWLELLTLEQEFRDRAAEDTIPSMALMLGMFDGTHLSGSVISYEGVTGVGYTIAKMSPGPATESLLPQIVAVHQKKMKAIRSQESLLVRLARSALETYVGERLLVASPNPLPPELDKPAGCFVTIKRHGQLRGCMGTVDPIMDHLADEIIRNAIEAGTEDDRFFPVEKEELDQLVYSVDVLGEEERVYNLTQLDPKIYGLIVIQGEKNALLLPDLEGVETIEEQISLTKEKADIGADEQEVEYYRFRVDRYV